jgi:hypothetical protein
MTGSPYSKSVKNYIKLFAPKSSVKGSKIKTNHNLGLNLFLFLNENILSYLFRKVDYFIVTFYFKAIIEIKDL